MPDADGKITEKETLLVAIGRVSVAWADLEELLTFGLWCAAGLMDKDPVDIKTLYVLTDRMDATQVARKLTALLIHQHGDTHPIVKRVEASLSRMHGLKEDRNRMIHGTWIPGEPGTGIHTRVYKKVTRRIEVERAPIDVKQIEKLTEDIEKLGNWLIEDLSMLGVLRT